MTSLILTPEQSQLIKSGADVVLSSQGETLGHLMPAISRGQSAFTPEEIEEALREAEADSEVIPHAEVMERLRVRRFS